MLETSAPYTSYGGDHKIFILELFKLRVVPTFQTILAVLKTNLIEKLFSCSLATTLPTLNHFIDSSSQSLMLGWCSFQDSGLGMSYSNTHNAGRRSLSPKRRPRSLSPSRRMLTSSPRPDDTVVNHNKNFLVRKKDDKLLENRDFSSFTRPKPRRSRSPTRRPRSASPSRSMMGSSMIEPLPCK